MRMKVFPKCPLNKGFMPPRAEWPRAEWQKSDFEEGTCSMRLQRSTRTWSISFQWKEPVTLWTSWMHRLAPSQPCYPVTVLTPPLPSSCIRILTFRTLLFLTKTKMINTSNSESESGKTEKRSDVLFRVTQEVGGKQEWSEAPNSGSFVLPLHALLVP